MEARVWRSGRGRKMPPLVLRRHLGRQELHGAPLGVVLAIGAAFAETDVAATGRRFQVHVGAAGGYLARKAGGGQGKYTSPEDIELA